MSDEWRQWSARLRFCVPLEVLSAARTFVDVAGGFVFTPDCLIPVASQGATVHVDDIPILCSGASRLALSVPRLGAWPLHIWCFFLPEKIEGAEKRRVSFPRLWFRERRFGD